MCLGSWKTIISCTSIVGQAIPNSCHLEAMQLHSSGLEGTTAMKSLFYAFNAYCQFQRGNMYTTDFWALDRGCAVAVFME